MGQKLVDWVSNFHTENMRLVTEEPWHTNLEILQWSQLWHEEYKALIMDTIESAKIVGSKKWWGEIDKNLSNIFNDLSFII